MIQEQFARKAADILRQDPQVIGLAVGGSFIYKETDDYSDLDLVLVTSEKWAPDKQRMIKYADQLGHLLTSFTGEHVGEPRVLICLYKDPLLHVDIKFLSLEEFHHRVEDPIVLLERDGELSQVIRSTRSEWPALDYQSIEDRFWIFIHYGLLKIGRGEFFEALDFISYVRLTVMGPLLQTKNGNQPRGVRKAETRLVPEDLAVLESTIATNNRRSLLDAVEHLIKHYRALRKEVFDPGIMLQVDAEREVLGYYHFISNKT